MAVAVSTTDLKTGDLEYVEVTPEIAEAWLGQNPRNRRLSPSHVEALAGAMERGEWNGRNGETIKILRDGSLGDGQHRLAAVVQTGRAIELAVVHNVDPEAMATIDAGRPRTFANFLEMQEEPNARKIAAAVTQLWTYRSGGQIGTTSFVRPTIDQLHATLAENPGIRGSVSIGDRLASEGVKLPASVANALHYLFVEAQSRSDADAFFDQLASGANLAEDSPIFHLRRLLVRELAPATGRLTARYKGALTIKAFNAWIEGQPLKNLRWKAGGAKPEAYPKITGTPGDVG